MRSLHRESGADAPRYRGTSTFVLLLGAVAFGACAQEPTAASRLPIAPLEANADVSESAVAPWDITLLPLLPGGTWSEATGISDPGVIVGFGDVAGGAIHAFRYANGTLTDLGTRKGYPHSRAWGINRNGEVVGSIAGAARGGSKAVIWSASGQISNLPGTDTVQGSVAYAINTGGMVVGTFTRGNGWHAARWSKGKLEDLTPAGTMPGLNTEARAVNASGAAVGFGAFSPTAYFGVKWNAAKNPTYLTPLPGADSSRAYDINTSGVWVGWSSYPTAASAATYISSILYEFNPPASGVIGSPESAISDKLRMVGTLRQGARNRAWTSTWLAGGASFGEMLPLPIPYAVSKAADVNTCGRVVGWVNPLHSTARRAALWTRFVRSRTGVKSYPCD